MRRAHCAKGAPIDAEVILVATGRRPEHGRASASPRRASLLGPVGEIVVDGNSQSSVPSIHAVGDVTNRVNLTPVAIREGHAFADSVFGGKAWAAEHGLVASAVFTTPEIGTVGLGEAAGAGGGL